MTCTSAACVSGTCSYTSMCTVIADVGGVSLHVDATYAYGANGTSIWRVPLAGGAVETLTTACSSTGCYVASNGVQIDDQSIYYPSVGGTLWKMPQAGGTVLALTSSAFTGTALDESYVYGTATTGTLPTIIVRVPKAGGAVETVYTAPPQGPQPSESYLEQSPAANADGIFWLEFNPNGGGFPVALPTNAVLQAPLAGGSPTTFASTASTNGSWTQLSVQGSYAIWLHVVAGAGVNQFSILTAPTAGGATTLTGNVSTRLSAFVGPVFDGTTLYWSVQDNQIAATTSSVYAAPIGGAQTVFASGSPVILSLATDASNVYWLTADALVRKSK